MNQPSWWTTITTSDLLNLHRRLLGYVRKEFGGGRLVDHEDVVQQAFSLLIQRRLEVSADHDGLFRYLCTVAHHIATDALRKKNTRDKADARRLARPEEESRSDPAAAAARGAEILEIFKILRALDDVDRLIIWAHVVEERSLRSICRELGMSWHQVLGSLERTMRRFRKELG